MQAEGRRDAASRMHSSARWSAARSELRVLVAAYFLFGTEHIGVGDCRRDCWWALACGPRSPRKVTQATCAGRTRPRSLAIAAFVGGKFVVAEIAARQIAANVVTALRQCPPPLASDRSADPRRQASRERSDATERASATMTLRREDPAPRHKLESMPREADRVSTTAATEPPSNSDSGFLDLGLSSGSAVAALVAYELGRGSGMACASGQTVPANASVTCVRELVESNHGN